MTRKEFQNRNKASFRFKLELPWSFEYISRHYETTIVIDNQEAYVGRMVENRCGFHIENGPIQMKCKSRVFKFKDITEIT